MRPSELEIATVPMGCDAPVVTLRPADESKRFLGPYRLLSELGHGGMGVVWLAERSDGHLKRPVALKLPLQTLAQLPQFLLRFEQERDILSALVHPNIARLYDADVFEGRPYLVLEYVDGKPLTDYCDERKTSVAERLQLFSQILSAVQYAHAHLVVHRDLKPSNIFVTNSGEIKLLDFGTAKLLSDAVARNGNLTDAGANALTPNYASPEQLASLPVSTATDIYSLGIVLFELLSGSRPTRPQKEALTAPSGVATAEAAERCALTRDKLRRTLRGDLDSIVRKCMRPEPGERYASAAALADDIDRYLAGRSVAARGDAASYRVRKFLRRHILGAVFSAVALLAVLAATVAATLGWQQARSEARRSEATESFLKEIFTANTSDQSDPMRARQTTARELLDIGRNKIKTTLRNAPAARLDVLSTLRDLYSDLGLNDQAAALGREEVSLARQLSGNRAERTAEALIHLGETLHASNSVGQREQVLLEAQSILDSRNDRISHTRALLNKTFSEHYQSTDLQKSLSFAAGAVAIYRRLPPSEDFAEALYEKSLAHSTLRQPQQADAAITEAIAISRKLKGDGNTELPRFYAYQGEIRQQLMQFAAAEESFRSAFAIARQLKGRDDVDTIETELRLGIFLFYTSRPAEGLSHLRSALDTSLRVKGSADPFYTPKTQHEYGWALANFGRLREGLGYLSDAIENRRKNRPGTVYLAQMLTRRASALIEWGDIAGAEASLKESAAIRERTKVPSDWVFVRTQARLLEAGGHLPEAAAALDRFTVSKAHENSTVDALRIEEAQVEAALDHGLYPQAAKQGERLLDRIVQGSDRAYLQNEEANVSFATGRAFLLEQDRDRALPLLRSAVSLRRKLLDPDSPRLGEAERLLKQCERRKAKD